MFLLWRILLGTCALTMCAPAAAMATPVDAAPARSYFIAGARRDVAGVSFWGECPFCPLLRQDVASPASNQAPSILRDQSSGSANIAAVSGLQRGDGEEGPGRGSAQPASTANFLAIPLV
jgi:hypothetical protein